MTDFIREVDDEVRQDRFKQILQRYWVLFAGLAVLILASVGVWQAYDHFRTSKAEASGGRYLDALDLARDGKTDQAVAALKAVAADGTDGYRLLARLRLAAALGTTDSAAGAKLFDEVAADPSVDPAIQSLARLRAAALMLDGSYAEAKARLDPLADANSPVRNAARELLALLALKADRVEEAGRALDAIQADPTATPQLRQRAATLQGLVRSAGKPPAPAPAPPAPAAAAPAAVAASPAPAATPTDGAPASPAPVEPAK